MQTPPAESLPDHSGIMLSIVIPALNEADSVCQLVGEIDTAFAAKEYAFEAIIVDDGSTDDTLARLRELAASHPWLRVLHRDVRMGQSAAFAAGFAAARGRYVATLDADLQNDPADLPRMLESLRRQDADMVQGIRANRRDSGVRLLSSAVGRTARRWLLGDPVRDTGCSTRVFKAAMARQYPLQFAGMHRFLPIYAAMLGGRIVEEPVNHRPRVAGESKYGIFNRALPGLFDCLAVRWMAKRYRAPGCDEVTVESAQGASHG